MSRAPRHTTRLLNGLRQSVGFVFILVALALFAYALVPRAEAATPTPPRLTVANLAVDRGAPALEQASQLAARFGQNQVTLQLEDRALPLVVSELGLEVDLERLSGLLSAAADPTSALSRELPAGQRELALPMPITDSYARAMDRLMELRRSFDRDARDAHYDVDNQALQQGQRGRHLDVWATLEAIEDAARRGETRVAAVIAESAPAVTVEHPADGDFSVPLGQFSTHYNAMKRERSANLRAAARRIRGTVLPPGGVFDFNEVVGERSLANGFRPATVIAGGELIDGVGGGACQVAGSLHAAAFFAGLPILERHPHSRPSSYIKMGLDAAVSFPRLNLRFQNDLPFPVALDLTVEGGLVTGRILGRVQTRQVSFIRRIDGFDTYTERDTPDANLAGGQRVLAQRGVPGFRVTRFRVIRTPETNQSIRERMETDTYPPTTQIWRVGTGPTAPEDAEAPTGDTHREYRADQYVVMTQGRDVSDTAEIHRAGRTGAPGWTEREGMPQP